MKKYFWLILSGLSLVGAILFAFVIQIPLGSSGVSISQPLIGGITSEPISLGDALMLVDEFESASLILVIGVWAFISLTMVFLILFGLSLKKASSQASPVSEMKKCPFCAEEIQLKAVICKHCNKELTPAGGK